MIQNNEVKARLIKYLKEIYTDDSVDDFIGDNCSLMLVNEEKKQWIKLDDHKVEVMCAFNDVITSNAIRLANRQSMRVIRDVSVLKERLHKIECILSKIERENKIPDTRLVKLLYESCEKIHKSLNKEY